MKLAGIAAFVIAAVPLAASAANLGIIDGSVRDAGTPVPGAHVLLLRDGHRVDEHVTDANGHFEFEQVPFGSYQVKGMTAEGKTQQHDIRLASGEVVEIELALALPSVGEEMVVTAQRPKAPLPAKTDRERATTRSPARK